MERVMADVEQKDIKPPRQVGVRDFRGNMTGILRQARRGETFLITSHGEVIAELRPPSVVERRRRQPGALRGKIQLSPDFNELPADLLAAMEGDHG
jgi:antitoxin (DNA-binding transcriptional repressor) of toxin-antitoxin stability system